MIMASLYVDAPTGKIMNSWQARRLPAWLPPLMTLKDGTGMTKLSIGFPEIFAMYLYSGISLAAAPARQTAMDTARIAFAPILDLLQPHSFLEPSSTSTINLSISAWPVTSMPINFGAKISLTLDTALSTPLPNK